MGTGKITLLLQNVYVLHEEHDVKDTVHVHGCCQLWVEIYLNVL